jgi:hypothetical protein
MERRRKKGRKGGETMKISFLLAMAACRKRLGRMAFRASFSRVYRNFSEAIEIYFRYLHADGY